ncbi:MAG: PQQ-binding-like beta-propeller repeat protein [Planctomycetes bacterium]|nr:PQQ-binding-like beta-propeller repeat protein [Planctomycetota bacterium]
MATPIRVGVLFFVLLVAANVKATPEFHLRNEVSLNGFGGIPFCADLDADGDTDVLWLQSPGLFHSRVFDRPPWNESITEDDRRHFLLTATDANGNVMWRLGTPWRGERPFVTHGAERALDVADLDGDGELEVVCVRRSEILVIDGRSGKIEHSVKSENDTVQIIRVARTGSSPERWTILAKNSERTDVPSQYANPAWFYDVDLKLLKKFGYLGAGHAPLVTDLDEDGLDEFIIGFNLVDHKLRTVWSFQPTIPKEWDAYQMHVDHIDVGRVGGVKVVGFAASDTAYLLRASDGKLLWKRRGEHPQHCRVGRFHPEMDDGQLFVHNKRADLQLFDASGTELWRVTPPQNFPLGQAAPCKRRKFHVFDPTTELKAHGANETSLLIFTDAGWPYVLDGRGKRVAEFSHTPNAAQDWGEVPGRPDDYGYGYYARIEDFDADGDIEVLLNDRRFAWFYEISSPVE